jgi:hypothetical protein
LLAELIVWAGVAASPAARRLGYARGAVSLWSRRRRCAKDWAAHEEKTRAFALSAAEAAPRRDTLWLLGGGTLADLPLAGLAALYRRVIVFDIALLAAARREVRRHPNVELRAADVTGIVAALAEWRAGAPLPVPAPDALHALDPVPPDCVLSLNLLSQLPLLPVQWLQKRGTSRTGAESLGRAILRAHLDGLATLGCPVALVTDRMRLWRDREGAVVLQENAVLDIALPPPEQSWRWSLAPHGEIDADLALDMDVIAARLPGRD